jgi:hypothetical protein
MNRSGLPVSAINCGSYSGIRAASRFSKWPDQRFEREHVTPEQAARYEADAWEEPIAAFLSGRPRATLPEIANKALGLRTERIGTKEQPGRTPRIAPSRLVYINSKSKTATDCSSHSSGHRSSRVSRVRMSGLDGRAQTRETQQLRWRIRQPNQMAPILLKPHPRAWARVDRSRRRRSTQPPGRPRRRTRRRAILPRLVKALRPSPPLNPPRMMYLWVAQARAISRLARPMTPIASKAVLPIGRRRAALGILPRRRSRLARRSLNRPKPSAPIRARHRTKKSSLIRRARASVRPSASDSISRQSPNAVLRPSAGRVADRMQINVETWPRAIAGRGGKIVRPTK